MVVIKNMLFPLIKRYLKLFLSMVGVSALAVALLSAMPSAVNNTNLAFTEFKKDCGYADCILNTELAPRRYADKLIDVEGVQEVNQRIGIPTYMKAPDGTVATAMMCSYLDADFYDRYILSETSKSQDMINVSVEKRFAENNGITAGQTLNFYIYGTEIKAFVSAVVYTPETIYVNSNPYLMADNTGFGYVFIEDSDLAKAVKESEGGSFELFWADFFGGLIRDGELNYSNQVLIKCEEGADRQTVLDACEEELSKYVKVTSAAIQENTSSAGYMAKFKKTFGMVVTVFPLFFYCIMLFIVVMFLNQMVMYMTHDIGILMALGTSKKDIAALLSVFSLCISGVAFVIGTIIAILICIFCTNELLEVYQLPPVIKSLNFGYVILSLVVTVLVGQLATLFATLKVTHITPKDAMGNNDTNKKMISEGLEKKLDRFSSARKLNICITLQNPRRIIVSVFSVMAAFMVIFISTSFKQSKDSVLVQILDERYNFDFFYLSNDDNPNRIYQKLSTLNGIDDIEIIEYLQATAASDTNEMKINICGLEPGAEMFLMPDERGRVGNVTVEGKGIWLNIDQARSLGVKAGDTIYIDGTPVEIRGLTHEYMNMISAVSQEQMAELTDKATTGFMMKVSDRTALDKFLQDQRSASVICKHENISKDLKLRIQPLDILVAIMMVFAILMGIIILVMMAQASLLEQQRLICTMKVLGFSSGDISQMWLRQESVYMIGGVILGIPFGILIYKILMTSIINDAWSFPIEIYPLLLLLSIAVITGTVTATHFLSMRLTKKWNLAESTKDRE